MMKIIPLIIFISTLIKRNIYWYSLVVNKRFFKDIECAVCKNETEAIAYSILCKLYELWVRIYSANEAHLQYKWGCGVRARYIIKFWKRQVLLIDVYEWIITLTGVSIKNKLQPMEGCKNQSIKNVKENLVPNSYWIWNMIFIRKFTIVNILS